MAVSRCIRISGGVITNVEMADPSIQPGDGSTLVASDAGGPGDAYANGVITPAAVVAAVPASVDLWRARAVLAGTSFSPAQAQAQYQSAVAGQTTLLGAANALIASMNNPVLSEFWANAQTIAATDPTLLMIATALGVSTATLNNLLIQAASISL